MLSFIPKRKTGVSKTKRQTYASRDYLLHILNWIKNYTILVPNSGWSSYYLLFHFLALNFGTHQVTNVTAKLVTKKLLMVTAKMLTNVPLVSTPNAMRMQNA